MCGLNGAAGTLDHKAEATFKDLLFLHTVRGEHSTGAASIGRMKDAQVMQAKCLGPPWLLMDMGRFKKDVMGGSNKVYMGHNRFATRGGITLGNAHPFVFENVFGAHNGTVGDAYIKKLPERDYFVTDSQAIVNSIDKLGIVETMKLIPKNSDGAWALTWYDKRDNTINFLRNAKRPLYIAFNKARDQLFWASELDFLAYALGHNTVQRDTPPAYRLTENNLYSWKIPEYNKPFAGPDRKIIECGPEVVHDAAPFRAGRSGIQVSGITDLYDDRSGGNGTRYYSVTGKEGNIVDLASKDRPGLHERLMTEKKGPKYPMIFKSENCKIHYDVDEKRYHRYYYSPTEYLWHHSSHDNPPIEIADQKLDDLLVKPMFLVSVKDQPETEPPAEKSWFRRYSSSHLWVFKKPSNLKDEKPWVAFWWDQQRGGWSARHDSVPPAQMPFSLYDADASHFIYTRKKKAKRAREQFYKGYNGELMTRDEFNSVCQEGCVGCGRIPRWLDGKMGAVRVHFVSKQDFLCEFCGEDSEVLKGLLAASKEETQTPTIN